MGKADPTHPVMSETNIKPLHVLLFGPADSETAALVGVGAHVEQADTFEQALNFLHDKPYDFVISRSAPLLPDQNRKIKRTAAKVIQDVDYGVCIVGESGEVEWANTKMRDFADVVRDRVHGYCVDTLAQAKAMVRSDSLGAMGRRFIFSAENDGEDSHFELTIIPVIDAHRRLIQAAAVVWEGRNSPRLQEKIDAVERAGRELLSLDTNTFSLLDPRTRLAMLEQNTVRCAKDILQFDHVDVRILDKQTNGLVRVFSCGMPDEPPGFRLPVGTEGKGICGYVAASGRSYICDDATTDPRYLPALSGAKSSLTVPLWLHDHVLGVANFESLEPNAFNQDDRLFAEIFGRYVALAMHLMELLASERQTTTGQLGSHLLTQITGPLNDILTDVESLVEDYIGHDDLRHRLRNISGNAVKIRESIREVVSDKPGILNARSKPPIPPDPILTGKRVLVADDEEVLRETIGHVLTGCGCRVVTAQDGAAAIKLLECETFDLILSDVMMPHKTGHEVFTAAKTVNPDMPVILTTSFGYDPSHSIIHARSAGLSCVLFKPFKVDQLLNEVRSALTVVHR